MESLLGREKQMLVTTAMKHSGLGLSFAGGCDMGALLEYLGHSLQPDYQFVIYMSLSSSGVQLRRDCAKRKLAGVNCYSELQR